MNVNSKIFDSIDELKYNLEIFEETIQNNPHLDDGFIAFLDIFQTDLQQCSSDEEINFIATYNLPERLGEVARKLTEITGKILDFDMSSFSEIQVPLIGQIQSLSSLVDGYSSDGSPSGKAIKTNLAALDKNFDYCSIKGDGHCLYRGLAAGVSDLIRRGGASAAQKILEQLNASIAKIKAKKDTAALEALLKECQVALGRLLGQNPCTVEEVIGNNQLSNKLVEFFRALACEFNVANSNPLDPNDTFTNFANTYSNNVTDYVTNMKDMSKADLGTEIEIVALTQCLGVQIEVFSPDLNQKNTFGNNTNGKIALLYRPGHYDWLVRKAPHLTASA